MKSPQNPPQDPTRKGPARNPLQRRDILKTLGLGAAGAAAATVLPAGTRRRRWNRRRSR